jgi:hypothetical protein
MWSVPNQSLRSTNSECPPQTNSSQSDFTGRIDRRLSFVYISLFVLLLIVGGASLYLLGSHLIKSAAISRQSEQIHIVEQIDRHLQTFTSAIQLAHLQGNTITNHYLEDSSRQFETLLTLYRNSGGSERNILEMRQMISDAESVTAAIANRMRNNLNPTPPVNTHDLTVMESIQQRIQSFTERVSAEHERVEDELVSESKPGIGTKVTIHLPLLYPKANETHSATVGLTITPFFERVWSVFWNKKEVSRLSAKPTMASKRSRKQKCFARILC